jgi:hypothetical protein
LGGEQIVVAIGVICSGGEQIGVHGINKLLVVMRNDE